MIKRSFFGLAKPKLKTPAVAVGRQSDIKAIPLPQKVTLLLKSDEIGEGGLLIQIGDKVRTGQRLRIGDEDRTYCISPVTGTVCSIARHTGYLGRSFRSITIEGTEEDQWDQEFGTEGGTPSQDNALRFLGSLPGAPEFKNLVDPRFPIKIVVISGMDRDLLVETNRHLLRTDRGDLKQGLEVLKKIRPVGRVVLAVPSDLVAKAPQSGVEVKVMDIAYPYTLPRLMVEKILGEAVPATGKLEEAGVGFVSAEAVMALGKAFRDRVMPVEKVLTVIGKDESPTVVRVRVGTPVRDVLESLNIEAGHGDRIVFGGPMAGQAVYSLDAPVGVDTDALMIQDTTEVIPWADTHCVNCGECVRACPADVPVNMLVRFLENGLFEEAAERYDLFSCVECGLCSYVCIARIPIFQYIMLGKYECNRMNQAEESHA